MKAKKILLNSIPLLFVGWIMAYAAAPTGGYLPNATLDPDCAPNDTDCFVQIAPDLWSAWDNADGTVADESGSINYTEWNVGVGTTNPIATLDVIGGVGTWLVSRMISDVSTTSFLQFGQDPALDFASLGVVDWKLTLSGSGDPTLSSDITVDNNGNVGIGTTNPVWRLSVVGLVSWTNDLVAPGTLAGALCITTQGHVYIDTDGTCAN